VFNSIIIMVVSCTVSEIWLYLFVSISFFAVVHLCAIGMTHPL